MKICEISADSFGKEALDVDVPIVVEFFSHSCPHCIKFAPVYAHAAEALDGEAQFVKIDVILSEANRNLAHNRGVRTVPTIEVFYRDRVIGSIVCYHEIKKNRIHNQRISVQETGECRTKNITDGAKSARAQIERMVKF